MQVKNARRSHFLINITRLIIYENLGIEYTYDDKAMGSFYRLMRTNCSNMGLIILI